MHGDGIYKIPNGREFYGSFKDNLKEGKGEYKWKNGKSLICNFIKGKATGVGFLKDSYEGNEYIITLEEIKSILKSNHTTTKENSLLKSVHSNFDTESEILVDLCSSS